MSFEQSYGNFNIYDIFANFLPGSILLIGIFLPIVGPKRLLVELGLGSLVIIIILSFAAGFAIQAMGSLISSVDSDFVNHMEEVDADTDEDEASDIIALDVKFLELCRADNGLSAEFDDWGRLFRHLIVELDGSSRSRTIRLQALYLAMRGMAVTSLCLFVYFSVIFVGVTCGKWDVSLSTELIGVFAVGSIIATILFGFRQREFSSSVTKNMISEYGQGIEL